MTHALYIFVDDDFTDPLYADPDPGELEEDLWEAICTAVNDALEGDGASDGTSEHEGFSYAWKLHTRIGVSFVVIAQDIDPEEIVDYLSSLSTQYLDEVDSPRHPEKGGIEDVLVEVIPPWEE